jgi:hypothetical protein
MRADVTRRLVSLAFAALLAPHSLLAQTIDADRPPPPVPAPAEFVPRAGFEVDFERLFADRTPLISQPAPDGNRACDGCPPRRIGTAFFQATMINVFYVLGNLARGEETAKITPASWGDNLAHGWEWDLNDFATNQIGHPYQGNNYYTAGRANGLSFWESSALAAFGSATWEYFGETNHASLNDFVNTTLGGIALGEMFHRAAWLIRDTRATGRGRLWREIAATAIDPLTGYNRFVSGDASRVTDKPPEFVPSTRSALTSAGALWRENGGTYETSPFLELNLLYGDLTTGRSRNPYDAFAVRLDFGGGRAFSEAHVRGRLISQPFREGALQLTVSQGYQYNSNDAYQFGAQSVEVNVSTLKRLNARLSMFAIGWGGLTILGAVDSAPVVTGEAAPSPASAEEEVNRDYDYGPGTNVGGVLRIDRDRRAVLTFSYELHHLHVLDGVRAEHLLQRARATVNVPIRGKLGAGVTGEFFDRRTYFQQAGINDASFRFPQFRAFVTWSAE